MQLVAQETKSQAKDVELLAVKINSAVGNSTIDHSILMDAANMLPQAVNDSNVTLEHLERQDTVGRISSSCTFNKNLVSWNYKWVIKSNWITLKFLCLLMFPLVSHLNNFFTVLSDACVHAEEFCSMMKIIQLV